MKEKILLTLSVFFILLAIKRSGLFPRLRLLAFSLGLAPKTFHSIFTTILIISLLLSQMPLVLQTSTSSLKSFLEAFMLIHFVQLQLPYLENFYCLLSYSSAFIMGLSLIYHSIHYHHYLHHLCLQKPPWKKTCSLDFSPVGSVKLLLWSNQHPHHSLCLTMLQQMEMQKHHKSYLERLQQDEEQKITWTTHSKCFHGKSFTNFLIQSFLFVHMNQTNCNLSCIASALQIYHHPNKAGFNPQNFPLYSTSSLSTKHHTLPNSNMPRQNALLEQDNSYCSFQKAFMNAHAVNIVKSQKRINTFEASAHVLFLFHATRKGSSYNILDNISSCSSLAFYRPLNFYNTPINSQYIFCIWVAPLGTFRSHFIFVSTKKRKEKKDNSAQQQNLNLPCLSCYMKDNKNNKLHRRVQADWIQKNLSNSSSMSYTSFMSIIHARPAIQLDIF